MSESKFNSSILTQEAIDRNAKQRARYYEDALEEHLNALNQLHDVTADNHRQWDTHSIGLSSVLLALSVTMLSRVIDFEDAKYMYLLYGAWVGFWLAIVGTYINYYFADNGFKVAK